MFFGTNTSMVKRQSGTQSQPAIGFLQTKFATKAAAGATGIALTSLTIPPEMAAQGFTNPTGAQIVAAQLLFYRRNLTLWSSLRGRMTDFYHYTISTSSTISFLGFTAEEGEIFEGTIDYQATTGNTIAATVSPPSSGTLATSATDFNVGFPFQVNANSTTQIGNVLVYRNGQLQVRNVSNATAGVAADGDYQEIDSGSGSGQIIRFNRPDPDNTSAIVVVPNGRLLELPSTSNQAMLEYLNGQINGMAAYVAALIGGGISVATLLGSAPTNVDLKTFGDRVLAMEINRARIDLANTWTVVQALIGRTDGSSVPAGIIGEYQETLFDGVVATAGVSNVTSMTLQPGVWAVWAFGNLEATSTTAFTLNNSIGDFNLATTSGGSGGVVGKTRTFPTLPNNAAAPGAGARFAMAQIPRQRLIVTTASTYYITSAVAFTGTAPTWEGIFAAERIG